MFLRPRLARFVFELVTAPAIDEVGAGTQLTFATESSQLRRAWILQIKSRLRSPKYVETLKRLYLSGAAEDTQE